jgi:hypothetical protein
MSLFRGKQDVFAIRWERDGRSGYMPAYDLNWDEFAILKANGGILKDFDNKISTISKTVTDIGNKKLRCLIICLL